MSPTTLSKSILALVGVSSCAVELLSVDVTSAPESKIDAVRQRIGCKAVAVTHEMRTAFRLSYEILMLWKGRIHHKGAPASFIGSVNRLINQFVQREGKDGSLSGA